MVGEGCKDKAPENFKVIGCHTDSPVLRLAPITETKSAGFEQVAIQTYGGGLWETWLDRTLSLAGRVIVRNGTELESRYMVHKEPLLQIPNLAIHHSSERSKFTYDAETHLKPIIASSIIDSLMDKTEDAEEEKKEGELSSGVQKKHLTSFLELIANEVDSKPEDILDFELSLFDTNPPCVLGLHKEFIASPRIDNMLSSICAVKALVERAAAGTTDATVDMIICYDHEEVGSVSAQGAAGTVTSEALKRVFNHFHPGPLTSGLAEEYEIAIRKSLYLSCDMAHAQHPNYAAKHQPLHSPKLHQGIVLKVNCNQKYTSDSVSQSILREIADRCDVPLQDFIIKQGTGCGSTIGPTISANTGMKTVDIGVPQLAMHSIREFCGTTDALLYKTLMHEFFCSFTEVSGSLLTE